MDDTHALSLSSFAFVLQKNKVSNARLPTSQLVTPRRVIMRVAMVTIVTTKERPAVPVKSTIPPLVVVPKLALPTEMPVPMRKLKTLMDLKRDQVGKRRNWAK